MTLLCFQSALVCIFSKALIFLCLLKKKNNKKTRVLSSVDWFMCLTNKHFPKDFPILVHLFWASGRSKYLNVKHR